MNKEKPKVWQALLLTQAIGYINATGGKIQLKTRKYNTHRYMELINGIYI